MITYFTGKSKGDLLPLTFFFLIFATGLYGQDFPEFSFHGIADSRLAITDDQKSWLDEGLGKVRYGGLLSNQRGLFRISQAALTVRASWNQWFSTFCTVECGCRTGS